MELVFMEFWQHQCCGQPFAVGDAVSWPLARTSGDGLARLLGATLGGQVRWAVERHDDVVHHVTGVVSSIRTVFCEVELVEEHPDGPHSRAAAGSGVLQDAGRSAHREEREGLDWSGYLVELTGVQGLPDDAAG